MSIIGWIYGNPGVDMPDNDKLTWQEQMVQTLEEEGGATTLPVVRVLVVKSNSDPMGFYYVMDVGDTWICTCKSFRYRDDCQHVEAIWKALSGQSSESTSSSG